MYLEVNYQQKRMPLENGEPYNVNVISKLLIINMVNEMPILLSKIGILLFIHKIFLNKILFLIIYLHSKSVV